MKRTAIATMRAILYSIILASVVGFCLMTYGRAQK